MKPIFSLLAGLIFGLGLIISGMSDPAKVLNFLDLFGTWDPSLAFVMGGAIAVTLPGYRLVLNRPSPLFEEGFGLPSKRDLDPQLITGATVFGLGWGLSGFCPGPAITSLTLWNPNTWIFFAFMIFGMWLAKIAKNRPVVHA